MLAAQLRAAPRPNGLQHGLCRTACAAAGFQSASRHCRRRMAATTTSSLSDKAASSFMRSQLVYPKVVRVFQEWRSTTAFFGAQALMAATVAATLLPYDTILDVISSLGMPETIFIGLLKMALTSASTALLVKSLADLVLNKKAPAKPTEKLPTKCLPAAGNSTSSCSTAAADLRQATARLLTFLASIPFSEDYTSSKDQGPEKEDNRAKVGAGAHDGGTGALGRCKRRVSKRTAMGLFMNIGYMSAPLAAGGSNTPGPLPNSLAEGEGPPGPGWFFLRDLADAAGYERAGWVKMFINSTGDNWDDSARPFCFKWSYVQDFTSPINHPCHGAIKLRGWVPVALVVWRPSGDNLLLVGSLPSEVLGSRPTGALGVVTGGTSAVVSTSSYCNNSGAASFLGEPCQEEAEPTICVFELSPDIIGAFKLRPSARGRKVEVSWAGASRFGDEVSASNSSLESLNRAYYNFNIASSIGSTSRLALPPAGGSWASLGPLLLASTRSLSCMDAATRLVMAAAYRSAAAGRCPRPWPAGATPSPCCWVGPAGRLAASAGEACTPLDLKTSSAMGSGPVFDITPLTVEYFSNESSSRRPLALLAAPAAPFGLLSSTSTASLALPYSSPLAAGPEVSQEVVSLRGTSPRPSSPQLPAMAPAPTQEEEANNIVPSEATPEVLPQGPLPLVAAPATAAPAAGSSLTITSGRAQHLGRKTTQEDFLVTRSSPLVAAGGAISGRVTTAAVFDGHAGPAIARAAAKDLPGRLRKAYIRDGTTKGFGAECKAFDLIMALDPREKSGSTAAVAMVTGNTLVTANVGDSLIGLVKKNGDVITLSQQHNTLNQCELQRVRRQGGRLRAYSVPGAGDRVVHRVMDASDKWGLLCTRSLGDFPIKRAGPGITCMPHTTTTVLDPQEDVAVVVVSDGVTDGFHPAIMGLLVTDSLVRGYDATAVAACLVDTAFNKGVHDNISAAVMLLSWQ